MKHFDENACLANVSNIWWEGALSEADDVNILIKKWSTLFSLVIDKHAPLKSLQVSEKYCLWINKDLRCLMRSRDRLKKLPSEATPNYSSALTSILEIKLTNSAMN